MPRRKTLHVASTEAFTDPEDLRSQPLTIASMYHLQFVPLPEPVVTVVSQRIIDHDSPGVYRIVEHDFTER